MSGEIEAAGALATAGLAAKAIEGGGRAGEHDGACLNCDTPLEGAYCHACGQPAHISRTLGEAFHDFMHSVLHFDTKAWRTLPMIFVRPGTLTHQYIHGKRARYISPLALFLFTVFLMFFVFAFVGGPGENAVKVNANVTAENVVHPDAARDLRAKAIAERDLAKRALDEAEARAAEVEKEGKPGSGGVMAGITTGPRIRYEVAEKAVRDAEAAVTRTEASFAERRRQLDEAAKELAAEKAANPEAAPVLDAVEGVVKQAAEASDDARVQAGDATKSGEQGRWQDQLSAAARAGTLDINMGDAKLNEKVRQTLENPDLALYKLQQTTYKFSFLLVPISLPFIALLFLWRRGVTLFDHVVFSLYSLSFMSLFFLMLALLTGALGDSLIAPVIGTLGGIIPPTHMYFHLKGTYALGWWSALWRTFFLSIFALVAAMLFFLAILYLGLAI
ncbi:MAG: DUF3667 domain-containing protein [Hyphomonadaceae bacterium]|nr:DUF3667 domain-containing protein [Hyphomonadaceae bacterium]